MSPRNVRNWLCWLLLMVLAGCTSRPEPDLYPAGTEVSLEAWVASEAPFTLGPRSSQLFLDMLSQEPVQSDISSMTAAPMGTFTVDGNGYDWHGNGVIRVTGQGERLWHGPFTQRLINDVMRKDHATRESMQSILDEIEQDAAVANTPVTGPGHYPGGVNDALLQPAVP